MKEYFKKYYHEHPEKFKEYRKKYYKKRLQRYKNDPEYRERVLTRQRNKSLKMAHDFETAREKLIEKRGGKCEKCGFGDSRALIIHHPNGLTYNRKNYVQKLKEIKYHSENLEVICRNCHAIIHDLKHTLKKIGKDQKND